MKYSIKSILTLSCLIASTALFQNCGKSGDGATSNDTAASVTPPVVQNEACSISGGAGVALFGPLSTDEGTCSSQCSSLAGSHPNLACNFNGVDLAQQGSCTISGGAGLPLYSGLSVSRGTCYSQCSAQWTAHPNESCKWSGIELAPVATCAIVGGAGAQLYSGNVTHGQCYTACQSYISTHPNETCVWNGGSIL